MKKNIDTAKNYISTFTFASRQLGLEAPTMTVYCPEKNVVTAGNTPTSPAVAVTI